MLGKTTTCFVSGGRVCIKRYVLLLHVSRGADIIIIFLPGWFILLLFLVRGADIIKIIIIFSQGGQEIQASITQWRLVRGIVLTAYPYQNVDIYTRHLSLYNYWSIPGLRRPK